MIGERELPVACELDVELARRLGERPHEQPEPLVGVVLDHENAHAGKPFQQPQGVGKFGIRSRIISALSEWSGLDLRHLAALEAIAREGSVSRAAVRLGYTQSAVSQQLRALERIVGVTLVTRSAGMRAVELTEAGRQLLAHADAIAGHLETARADLAAFSDGRVGELRIGAVPSAAAALIPALAQELRARAPRLTLAMTESYFPESCSTAWPRASSTSSSRPRTSRAKASSPRRSCAIRTSCSCRPATRCWSSGGR